MTNCVQVLLSYSTCATPTRRGATTAPHQLASQTEGRTNNGQSRRNRQLTTTAHGTHLTPHSTLQHTIAPTSPPHRSPHWRPYHTAATAPPPTLMTSGNKSPKRRSTSFGAAASKNNVGASGDSLTSIPGTPGAGSGRACHTGAFTRPLFGLT